MESITLPSTAIDVSCFSSIEDRNVAYAQIQNDVSTLTRKLLELKIRHNSLNITARLPDELLARVFTWNLSMQRFDRYVRWIKVAGVCTSWRRVALACPHLWSFIYHGRTQWLDNVILPRSGGVPLQIWVDLNERQTWAAFRRALDEIHRVLELNLVLGTRNPVRTQDILSSLIKPAPILEKFGFVPHSTSNVYHLPDNLFAGEAPRLRELVLENCTIPAGCSLIPGLTSLDLNHPNGQGGFNVSQLITLLESAVNLEDLKLTLPCFTEDDLSIVQTPSNHIVVLPRLRHLSLEYDACGCLMILSCISFPMATCLNIHPITYYRETPTDNTIHILGNMLGTWISSVKHLMISDWCEHRIIAKRTPEPVNGTPSDPMELQVNMGSFTSLKFYKMFLQNLPLLFLESLEVSGEFPADLLLDVFGDVNSLHTICVKGHTLNLSRALLSGVSERELMATVMYGKEKWVGDLEKQPSMSVQDSIALKVRDDSVLSGVPENNFDNSPFQGMDSTDARTNGSEDAEESDEPEDEVKDASEVETLMSKGMSEASQDHLSDKERLLALKLPKVSGPLHFMSLRSLEIDLGRRVDTAVLAAVIHLRYARGSPIRELSVRQSTHYSPNADRHLATIRRFVESDVSWDVENELLAVQEEDTRQRVTSNTSEMSYPDRSSDTDMDDS